MREWLIALGLALCGCQTAMAGALAEEVTQFSQQNFQEYLKLLALDNVAAKPQDIVRNAAFLEQSFQKRGFKRDRNDKPPIPTMDGRRQLHR